MDTTSPAPKKMENLTTQPINQDVMELVANKGQPKSNPEIQQVKDRLLKIIKTSGADPQKIIMAAKYARQAVQKPELYPMAIEIAIKSGILTPDQAPKGEGIDYQLLANGITAGKLTEELIKEGKL